MSDRVCEIIRVKRPEDCCVCSSVFRIVSDEEEAEKYRVNPASLLATLFFTGMMHGVMSDRFHLCEQHEAVWNQIMRAADAEQIAPPRAAAARTPKRARR